MLTIEQQSDILCRITYKPNWTLIFTVASESTLCLQFSVTNSICSVSRETTNWKSGKRFTSQHMCRQELVGLVYAMAEAAEIHEAREWFRYKNASIFNPHLDPEALVKLASKASSFVCRDNAMSMEEILPARKVKKETRIQPFNGGFAIQHWVENSGWIYYVKNGYPRQFPTRARAENWLKA